MNKQTPLTMEQAAYIIGVSRATLYNRIDKEYKASGPVEIVREEIEQAKARVARMEQLLAIELNGAE